MQKIQKDFHYNLKKLLDYRHPTILFQRIVFNLRVQIALWFFDEFVEFKKLELTVQSTMGFLWYSNHQ